MTADKDMRQALIRTATTALWAFGGASITREQAEALLPEWVNVDLLDDAARAEVLWHVGGDAPAAPVETPVAEGPPAEAVSHAVARYLQPGGRSARKLFGFECCCGDLFEGASAPRARAAMDAHLKLVTA